VSMLSITPLLADETAATTAATTAGGGGMGILMTFLPFIVLIALMYFMLFRPQKKRQKEEQKMRNNLRVGDDITTIGGIKGRVLNIKEDELVIETGADRNKMTIKKWALQSVDTVHEDPAPDADDDDDDDI